MNDWKKAFKELERFGVNKLSGEYYNSFLANDSVANANLNQCFSNLYDNLIIPAEDAVDVDESTDDQNFVFDSFYQNSEGKWMASWNNPECEVPVSALVANDYSLLRKAFKFSMQKYYALKMVKALRLPDELTGRIISENYHTQYFFTFYPYGRFAGCDAVVKKAAEKVIHDGYMPIMEIADSNFVNVVFITNAAAEAQNDIEQCKKERPNVLAYVYNVKTPSYSEYGYITIQFVPKYHCDNNGFYEPTWIRTA
ncbi:hypothetical protein [Limosilactobacillus allomucosae]|uniref:hypothetical protein n=1 Tax=Limosilactobacillus allomucosae TaxID=3142938 RepID=UPI0032675C93